MGEERQSETRPRGVVLLGSTGSIGQSTLKVARELPERVQIVGLAAGRNLSALVAQAQEFGIEHLVSGCEEMAEPLRSLAPESCSVACGQQALCELAQLEEADIVLVAIVGVAGLAPALAAIEAGKVLAVASKEILVLAGGIVMEAARRKGVRVLPVDSEHNAIFQCLEGIEERQVRRVILTASGGPFRTTKREDFSSITLEAALEHPTWKMGAKITIDSATLFNKALEMIEARWLFGLTMDQVDVIVHPQSIVHSMVETLDGSLLAQLSVTDMCFPIQYALCYPDRVEGALPALDLAALGSLEFEKPRREDFPALDLASWAGEKGGTLPAVLNAANEVAVERFRARELSFEGIWQTVGAVMEAHELGAGTSLEELVAADHWARLQAQKVIAQRS